MEYIEKMSKENMKIKNTEKKTFG